MLVIISSVVVYILPTSSCFVVGKVLPMASSSETEHHYHAHMSNHEECRIPDALSIASSFMKMTKDVRIDTVRCMLLALTALPGSHNFLLYVSRMGLRFQNGETASCTTLYDLRSWVCVIITSDRRPKVNCD